MADDLTETITVTIDAGEAGTEKLVLPEGLLSLFAEEGDTPAGALADIAVLSLAQQVHGAVHHAQGEPSDELKALEAQTLDLFEERYGMTFAEATGHSH